MNTYLHAIRALLKSVVALGQQGLSMIDRAEQEARSARANDQAAALMRDLDLMQAMAQKGPAASGKMLAASWEAKDVAKLSGELFALPHGAEIGTIDFYVVSVGHGLTRDVYVAANADALEAFIASRKLKTFSPYCRVRLARDLGASS